MPQLLLGNTALTEVENESSKLDRRVCRVMTEGVGVVSLVTLIIIARGGLEE